jgi:lipid-A-disaccharide synthase-like uncharacterized protein
MNSQRSLHLYGSSTFWLVVGFTGQALFTSRFIIQWIASERKKESVFPVAFWYLSLVGGTMLLAYAISRVDPVIILGQALGVVVYMRNLVLIHQQRMRLAEREKELAVNAEKSVELPATVPMRRAG